MTRLRLVPASVLLVTAVGCGQQLPSGSSGEPVSASASAAVRELTTSPAPLPAGTYTRASFSPPISLELDGTWSAAQLLDGYFDVRQSVGGAPLYIQFTRPTAVFGAGDRPRDVTAAQQAVETAAGNPAMEVHGRSASRLGGVDGFVIELENTSDGHAGVVVAPPGPIGIEPDRRLWISFLDTSDGLMAVIVRGSAESWEDVLAVAEPVLESVRIGP